MADKKSKPNPSVSKGDHVFFNRDGSPVSGEVRAIGAHGCTIRHDGQHHKVYWADILGHKTKKQHDTEIVDRGETGFIIQDADGVRKYIDGEPPDPVRDDTDADHIDVLQYVHKNTPMRKSLTIPDNIDLIFFKSVSAVANRPGLTKKQITDKRGVRTTKWVRTGGKQHADVKRGAKVRYISGDHKGAGDVTAAGKHGATVSDSTGREHQVFHHEITHVSGANEENFKPKSTEKEFESPVDHHLGSKGIFTDKHLPEQYKNSIQAYIGADYRAINRTLRQDNHQAFAAQADKIAEHIMHIENAFNNVPPTTQEAIVYRKTGKTATDAMLKAAGSGQLKKGAILADDGIMSTSHDASVFPGAIGFEIKIPKGAKAIDLSETINAEEKEVILPPGTKLKVTEAKKDHKGYNMYIKCEVML